jgi:hypothetical protein
MIFTKREIVVSWSWLQPDAHNGRVRSEQALEASDLERGSSTRLGHRPTALLPSGSTPIAFHGQLDSVAASDVAEHETRKALLLYGTLHYITLLSSFQS